MFEQFRWLFFKTTVNPFLKLIIQAAIAIIRAHQALQLNIEETNLQFNEFIYFGPTIMVDAQCEFDIRNRILIAKRASERHILY